MRDPLVSVMRNRYVKGYPRNPDAESVEKLALSQALTRTFHADTHLVGYVSDCDRRLTREAIEAGIEFEMTTVFLDVDCPDIHGTNQRPPDAWRKLLRFRIETLAKIHPSPFVYETRGGLRIVYVLPTPFKIRTARDADEWSKDVAVLHAYLRNRFEIEADRSCLDWQRLFRAPHATRTEGSDPEDYPTFGNPGGVGALLFRPTKRDLVDASGSRAFHPKVCDFVPGPGSGKGLLFHLLSARGDIIRPHRDRSFVIRCPREELHSTGKTGDTSTILYRPARGKSLGAICCKHAHCADMAATDWLRCFSDVELERARECADLRRSA